MTLYSVFFIVCYGSWYWVTKNSKNYCVRVFCFIVSVDKDRSRSNDFSGTSYGPCDRRWVFTAFDVIDFYILTYKKEFIELNCW